jgi:GRAM domain
MNTPLNADEIILKDGPANLQRGAETVGGKVYLTSRWLVFEAHKFNLQRGATEIPLSDILSIAKCWTKFLNLIPVLPNSLAVTTNQGQEYRFVLFGRDAWEEAISGAKGA